MADCMRNWADLPSEMLNMILSNLFGKDMHSFRLVCRPWNTAVLTSPYPFLPCLVQYYRPTRTWNFYRCKYSSFNMSFPDLENSEIRCSKYGWLLMSRLNDSLFFFNPSTSHKINLPPKVLDLHTSLCFFNPPTSPECLVVGINTPFGTANVEICTLQRGEEEWDYMEYPTDYTKDFWVSLGPPVLHRGLIYLLSVKGDFAMLDTKKEALGAHFECLELDSDVKIEDQYLVKVNGEEELYAVFVFEDERKVKVFCLSSEMEWDLVESIGDKVLYLSHTSSFGYKAPTKCMENTIYFPKFHGDVAVFYSLSDGKYHSPGGDYLEDNAYGLKRLDFATWVRPNPEPEVITTISLSWSSLTA